LPSPNAHINILICMPQMPFGSIELSFARWRWGPYPFGHFSGRIEPQSNPILHILNDCHGLMCPTVIGSRAAVRKGLLKCQFIDWVHRYSSVSWGVNYFIFKYIVQLRRSPWAMKSIQIFQSLQSVLSIML